MIISRFCFGILFKKDELVMFDHIFDGNKIGLCGIELNPVQMLQKRVSGFDQNQRRLQDGHIAGDLLICQLDNLSQIVVIGFDYLEILGEQLGKFDDEPLYILIVKIKKFLEAKLNIGCYFQWQCDQLGLVNDNRSQLVSFQIKLVLEPAKPRVHL